MKKFVVFLLLIVLSGNVSAEQFTQSKPVYPEGSFKKMRNGCIAQYNSKGKKIGVYKNINGRFVRIK